MGVETQERPFTHRYFFAVDAPDAGPARDLIRAAVLGAELGGAAAGADKRREREHTAEQDPSRVHENVIGEAAQRQ